MAVTPHPLDWQSRILVRILLLVAKVAGPEPWRKDVQDLANHIACGF